LLKKPSPHSLSTDPQHKNQKSTTKTARMFLDRENL
jgi:hypothetical protein